MPYSITKGGGTCSSSEWAVVKDDDGKTMGCHTSKGDAEKQVAALYASEDRMPDNFSHIARVRLVSAARLEELRDIVTRNYAGDSGNELFFWDAEISNDLLDSHFTHMSEKTLQNYARDALNGVAFLKGHNWRELPIGYSLTGQLEDVGSKKRVVAGFYTVRGLQETDDLIRRMETGLLRDVSVGFHGGEMRCDICGSDFWECRHFPGLKYEEKKGDTVSTILSTFTIDDAGLSEVSGVFDGSTPDAMILKAERSARAGELTPEQVALLENRYRVALPKRSVHFMESKVEEEQEKKMTVEERWETIRKFLGVATDDEVNVAIANLLGRAEKAEQRVAELEPQAVDGAQYRSDLVADALAQGIRAQGNDFDKDLYEATLRNAPLALVKRMRDDWKRVADELLPSGRQTSNGDEVPAKTERASVVPNSAYA